MIGNVKALDETTKQIESTGLKIKIDKSTKDYLSCEVLFNKDKTRAWLGQPHLVKTLKTKFKDLVENKSITYMTPGTPGLNIVRPKTADEQISGDDQTIFRSGVGTLLQFIKYSRPDIANIVRELSKCMDKATPAAFKEMKRVMKFVIATQDYGLRMAPIHPKADVIKWNMRV